MGLANFFDKVALNASQILTNCNRNQFEEIIISKTIGVAFDLSAIKTSEGKATIDLSIRLLARLYSNLSLIIIGEFDDIFIEEMITLAKSINPKINISKNKKCDIAICIGKSKLNVEYPILYLGSNSWIAKFSLKEPMKSCDSGIPFGAGAIACIGVANIFRFVFQDLLPNYKLDSDFSLSLYDYSFYEGENIDLPEVLKQNDVVNIGKVDVVGIGAIGNSLIWALKNTKNLKGELHLIDHEKVSLSNLQRYVLTDQSSIDQPKVTLAKNFLSKSGLKVKSYSIKWESYLSTIKKYDLKNIVTCVDSAEDRIKVQSSLPKSIINAWTQRENLGISRHLDFINKPCLCCLYFPEKQKLSISQEIANQLGLSDQERIIRSYIANFIPVDEALIELISNANKFNIENLRPFVGKDINVFYSEVVCGGIIFNLTGKLEKSEQLEVPCAFQSALAGVLLASEIVLVFGSIRKTLIEEITKIDLLKPITKYVQSNEQKHENGRCICQDEVVKNVYLSKWQSK